LNKSRGGVSGFLGGARHRVLPVLVLLVLLLFARLGLLPFLAVLCGRVLTLAVFLVLLLLRFFRRWLSG
jgi:hypothetical protein